METHLEFLGTPGPALLAVAGLLGLAWRVGRPLVRDLAGPEGAERELLALVVGVDLLLLAIFPLAWSGLLFRLPPWLPGVVGIALVAPALVRAPRAFRGRPLPWSLTPLLVGAGVLGAHGLCPPFSWDDLVYQVAVPLRWCQAGGLPVFADNPYSGFPGAFSVLNAYLIAAGGILAPGLWNAVLWTLLALQLHALVRRNASGWHATALVLSFAACLPAVMEAISSYAELFLAVHVAALAVLVIGWRARATPPGSRSFWTAGVLAGVAASIKLTGWVVPALVVPALLWPRPREDSGRGRRLVPLAAFVLPFLAIVFAFYARPALATGNPFHPYFADHFSDDPAVLATSRYHHDAATAKFGAPLTGIASLARALVDVPWRLGAAPLGAATELDGWLGSQLWILLALVGLLALGWIRGRARPGASLPWVLAAAALFAAWFATSRQTRFLLPAFLLLAFAASFAWPLLAARARPVLAATLLLATAGSLPVRTLDHLGRAFGVLAGRVDPAAYVDSTMSDHYLAACEAIAEHTPPDARVLLLFEHRGLYVPRDYCIGTPYFQSEFFTPPDSVRSAAEFLAPLQRAGITHVLIGFNADDPDRLDAYLERTRAFQRLLVSMRGLRLVPLWENHDPAIGGDVRHGLYRVVAR